VTAMNKLGLAAISVVFLGAVVSGRFLPDASATYRTFPNYGKCAPKGKRGSVNLKTIDHDTLTVATVLPNPGFWNGVNIGSMEDGFEYCIAAEIANRAGLRNLKLKMLAWDQYISASATDYDLALASTTILEPRRAHFEFSQPYFASNLGVAVKRGDDVSADNIKHKRIGVLQGNVGSDWVTNTLKPDSSASFFQSGPEMVAALISGHIDALITDTTILLPAVHGTHGQLEVVGQYDLGQGYGVVMPKGSKNVAAVDSVVGTMKKTGRFDELSAKYLAPLYGGDPGRIPIWTLKSSMPGLVTR